PPLMWETARPTSVVTVPVFGFGIRPRGPSTRAIRPTLPIWSGVATAASKSRKPPWSRSARCSEATKARAAGACLLGALSGREDQRPDGLARAVREVDRAADHRVLLARVDAEPQR